MTPSKPKTPTTPVKKPRSAKPTVEVMKVDPFSAEIEDAVKWINKKVNTAVHTARVEIGQYLLDRFFGGDAKEFRSKNPQKEASLRALKARCDNEDIPFSMTALHSCVALAVQEHDMLNNQRYYKELGHSQKVLLLRVKDLDMKAALAENAVKEKLSCRAFREKVQEARRDEVGETDRGRPPKNSVMYLLDHVGKALEAREIEDEAYEALKEEYDILEVLETAEEMLSRLTVVVSALRRRKPKSKKKG